MEKPTVVPVEGTDIVRIVVHEDGLDVYSAPALRELSVQLIHEGRYRQILDLEGVYDADSTSLGVIVGAWQRAEHDHGGAFVLANVRSGLANTLKVTGLDKKLTVMPTLEDAIAYLSPLPESSAAPAERQPSIADRRRRLEADAEDAKKTLRNAQQRFDNICDELAALRREEREASNG